MTSETGAGGAPNSFSLQLNTNTFASAACSTAANPMTCQGWEQFMYTNGTGVFIQFWRLNYGPSCPQGWTDSAIPGTTQGCFKNSPVTSVPQQTIADLLNLSVTGSAQRNGSDTVVLTTATGAYQASNPDSTLGLAGSWTNAEFNIFGDCCAHQAVFNAGAQIAVGVNVNDGTSFKTSCSTNGTTAETNNATFVGPCCPEFQGIQFVERTTGGSGLLCTNTTIAVTGVSPNHGPTSGGTIVTVTGNGFFDSIHGPPIKFGGLPGTNADCPLPTQCTVTTPPAGEGTVDVTFATSAQNAADRFTYSGPTITGISPNEGAENGGTRVDLFGTELSENMQAEFNTFFVGITCVSSTHCSVFTPPGWGSVHITVGANVMSAPTPADLFTYKPFPVGDMGPSHGLPAGGTQVSIGGNNFATAPGATIVNFEMNGRSVPAIDLSCSSATQCTMKTPPLDPPGAGPVVAPVSMTVGGLTNSIGGFTYATPAPPPPPPKEFCSICRDEGGRCLEVHGKFICEGTLQ